MPQSFNLNESDLKGQLTKLNDTLSNMLEFAFLHEDMVTTIESLMTEWAIKVFRDKLDTFKKNYDSLPKSEKEIYSDFDEFMYDHSLWWLDQDSDENLKMVIKRFRLTIGVCLYSSSYNEDSLKEKIESNWDHEK
tara:strand:- start:987 stop:1391 length:405 start_codon:yes stop_codon:yes gene_type:complete